MNGSNLHVFNLISYLPICTKCVYGGPFRDLLLELVDPKIPLGFLVKVLYCKNKACFPIFIIILSEKTKF